VWSSTDVYLREIASLKALGKMPRRLRQSIFNFIFLRSIVYFHIIRQAFKIETYNYDAMRTLGLGQGVWYSIHRQNLRLSFLSLCK
jgi:hypothetical protein